MRIPHIVLPLILAATPALATPSGLNNIPTADTTPQMTFVVQPFTTIGKNRDTDFNLGFKTGLDFKFVKFEFGLASHIYPDEGGPITGHVKLAVPFGEHLPTLAIGAAGIPFTERDSERVGDVFGYAVLSEDLGWFRIHGGCAYVETNARPFYGLDKTFRYTKNVPAASEGKGLSKDGKSVAPAMTTKTIDLFTLRTDAIQQQDSTWLYSAGVLVPICKWFVFETWGNFPDNGDDASWTIKGNFVFSF